MNRVMAATRWMGALMKHKSPTTSHVARFSISQQRSFSVGKESQDIICSTPQIDILHTQPLIDGKFIETDNVMDNMDPRTGEAFCQISICTEKETNLAIQSSRNAFDSGIWHEKISNTHRSKLLHKYASLLEANRDYIAKLETYDAGKPLYESHFDIDLSIEVLEYYAGYAQDMPYYGEPGNFGLYSQVLGPLGVVGCITPWNYPLMQTIFKLAPALACGNTCVVKPAETAPLTNIYAGYLALEAGIPPGVINIVPGYGSVCGNRLVESELVDKISFTGSTRTARHIMRTLNPVNKKLTLELGGKSAVIINDIEDKEVNPNGMNDICQLFVDGCFVNSGQVCSAATRIFVNETIYDEFVETAVNIGKKSRFIGDPFDERFNQGPVQNEMQFKKILDFFDRQLNETNDKNKGPRVCIGGNRIGNKGYWIEPTIFSDVTDDMIIAKEEMFGPTMQILKYKNGSEGLDDVFNRANYATDYGLAAGFFSRDVDLCNRAARELEAGTVFINLYDVWDSSIPFGGYKQSGFGREKGQDTIKWFTKRKEIVQQYSKKKLLMYNDS